MEEEEGTEEEKEKVMALAAQGSAGTKKGLVVGLTGG